MKKVNHTIEKWEEKSLKKSAKRKKKIKPVMKVSGKQNITLKKIITDKREK